MTNNHRAARWPVHIGTVAVLALFASGLFSRCANIQGDISGGPKDTLPPRVVGMIPGFNATNIRPSRVTINFDEYVQLKNLQSEFFTSPFITPKPTVTIRKKGIRVDMAAPLDSATTYVLNFGSAVADNNEGNVYHGLKYTFSTGSHIDSMYMSGYVSDAFTADTVKGAYILFYNEWDYMGGPDSLLFDLNKAKSVAKTGSNGGFYYGNLKPIHYRLYALMDNNGNTMYDPGTDDVAFLDSLYHPADLPSFLMWYDSALMHTVAEPQLFFHTFREDPDRAQNLSEFIRPSEHLVSLKFSAGNPKIDSLVFRGVPPDRVITEYTGEKRDSILYWLDALPGELPDTLWGRIVYERPDSAGLLGWHGQDLRLVYNRPAPPPEPEQEPEPEKEPEPEDPELDALRAEGLLPEEGEPADTVPPSPMVFKFTSPEPVIPYDNLVLSFDLPVIRFDTASVQMFRTADGDDEQEIPFTVDADSLHIREFTFRAEWRDAEKYRLLIPAGAVETIDREINDEINHTFSVADQSKLASLTLRLAETNPEYEYIVQVIDTAAKTVIRELAHLTEGDHSIHYLAPGKVRLRLIEDSNRNGRWDTGILTRRVQPEQTRMYFDGAERTSNLTLVEGAEVQIDIDAHELFLPRVHVTAYSDSLDMYRHEHDHDHDHDHDHEGHTHEPATETEAGAPTGIFSGSDDIPAGAILVEPRVEEFEIISPREQKAAEKAARKAAKAERRRLQAERKAQLREQREAEKQR